MNDCANGDQRRHDSNTSLESLLCDGRTGNTFENIQWSDLCLILRTTKNWWRCHIQLYLPSRRQYPTETQERITRLDVESLWRSKRFLELLIHLLENLSAISSSEKHNESNHLQQGPNTLLKSSFISLSL